MGNRTMLGLILASATLTAPALVSAAPDDSAPTSVAATSIDYSGRQIGYDLFDINQTEPSSYPTALATLGDGMIFTLSDGIHGNEPFYVTRDSVTLIDDINPYGSSNGQDGLEHDGYIYFSADDGVHGAELWRTDGITAELVADINPDGPSDPVPLLSVGDVLYIEAFTPDTGSELFKLEGGEVSLVLDLYPGTSSGRPNVYSFGDQMAVRYTNAAGSQLQLFDGTAISAPPSIPGLTSVSSITTAGDRLYFRGVSSVYGDEIFSTNGTTAWVHEPAGSAGAGDSDPYYPTAVGDAIYFSADDTGGDGRELYRLDVAVSDTPTQVTDINESGDSRPRQLAAVGNRLYFSADDATGDREPYSYSATEGLRSLGDLNPSGDSNPLAFTGNNDVAYFRADVDERETIFEDRAGTVRDLAATSTPPVPIIDVMGDRLTTPDGSAIAFEALTTATGYELWWADADGLRLIEDVQATYGTASSEFTTVLGVVGTTMIVSATDGTDYALYAITDGEVTEIPGSAALGLEYIPGSATWNGMVVFEHGGVLYTTDGEAVTAAGTINASGNVGISDFAELGDKLYFVAENATNGNEIWSFDGTTVQEEYNLAGASDGATSSELHSHGGYIYYAGNDGTTGSELYRYDGVTAPITAFHQIDPGVGGGSPRRFHSFGDELLFAANGSEGWEPWVVRADDTVEILDDVNGTVDDSTVYPNFASHNGVAYFGTDRPTGNTRVMAYDGSSVTEIAALTGISGISPVVIDGDVIFRAPLDGGGGEIYRMAGDDIELVDELVPGSDGVDVPYVVTIDGQTRLLLGTMIVEYDSESGMTIVGRFIGDPVDYMYKFEDDQPYVLATGIVGDAEPAELGFVPNVPLAVTFDGNADEATITWSAPADPGSDDITGYDIEVSGGTATCDDSTRTCTWTGLDNGSSYDVEVTARNRFGSSVAATGTFAPDETFVSLTPSRILDTRGSDPVGELDGSGDAFVLQVTGVGGVPSSGVSAVALNVTVVDGQANDFGGFVTVFPCGTRPDASNLNFVSGQTVPNSVIAPLSASGEVCLYVYGVADLLVDVSGYFVSGFEPLTPDRILDTRGSDPVGELDGSGDAYTLQVTGGDVPESATAVALNVTVVDGQANDFGGFVTVFPCGTRPDASNLNFVSGQTVPNSVIAPLSADGEVCLYVYGQADLLVDVSGYFVSGFEPLTPDRILDTRGSDPVGELDGSGDAYTLQVTGGDVPESATAVALNVTVVDGEANDFGGFVTVFPCGTRPDASNLNFVSGQTVPNSVIAPLSATGTVCLYVYGQADLLVDVSGHL